MCSSDLVLYSDILNGYEAVDASAGVAEADNLTVVVVDAGVSVGVAIYYFSTYLNSQHYLNKN